MQRISIAFRLARKSSQSSELHRKTKKKPGIVGVEEER